MDHGMQIAGGTSVQLRFCYLAVTIVPYDLIFIHTVFLICPELQLMSENPERRHPDILVHRRGN